MRWQGYTARKSPPKYKRNGKVCSQLQAYVYDKLKAGEKIIVTFRNGEREYALTSGRVLDEPIINAMAKMGFIRPEGEGLFGGQPQAWVRDNGLR